MRLFATKLLLMLIVMLFFSILAAAQAPPCKCMPDPPGGEVYCEVTQYGTCGLDSQGRCIAKCKPIPNDRADIAAWVITAITGKAVTRAQFLEERERYVPILTDLLNNKTANGSFNIVYEGRSLGFSLPTEAESLLKQAAAKRESLGNPIGSIAMPSGANTESTTRRVTRVTSTANTSLQSIDPDMPTSVSNSEDNSTRVTRTSTTTTSLKKPRPRRSRKRNRRTRHFRGPAYIKHPRPQLKQ
jgi:hypothetical protein